MNLLKENELKIKMFEIYLINIYLWHTHIILEIKTSIWVLITLNGKFGKKIFLMCVTGNTIFTSINYQNLSRQLNFKYIRLN